MTCVYTVALQRGGNKISGLPPLQGGIKGGKSDLYIHGSPFQGELEGVKKLLKHALNLRSDIT